MNAAALFWSVRTTAEVGNKSKTIGGMMTKLTLVGGTQSPGGVKPTLSNRCGICRRLLNNPVDPVSLDCGGDCLQCMAAAGDPDCERHMDELRAAGKI